MGTFMGHVLPGAFFMVYAFWVIVLACRRLNTSARKGSRFVSTVAFSCPPACGRLSRLPFEAILKISLPLFGLTLEIITAMHDGKFTAIGNAQHATMFFYFLFSGVVDILVYYKAPLPPNTDYVILAMAFMVEGLLFKFHLHGRTELDVLLHTLLLYVVYACIISVIVEMKYRRTILSPLARGYFVLLQGTWFCQVGYILYCPIPGAVPWKADDHRELTIATLYFAWHALGNFIVVVGLSLVIHICMLGWKKNIEDTEVGMKILMHSESNGHTAVQLQEESESELEFQQPLVSSK